MDDLLLIDSANDYANDIGAPVYHPQVSVIHYDEMGEIRHSLCRFNVYGIFAQKNFPPDLQYGVGKYSTEEDALLAYAPGQIGGKTDDGTVAQYHGWVLLFDPEFIYGTEFGRNLGRYHYFSYNVNEALRMTEAETGIVEHIMLAIRRELSSMDSHTDRIVQDYILLLADFCNRFYDRQFQSMTSGRKDILARFQDVLADYYLNSLQLDQGIPNVKYCADQLNMSPSYFGDVIRKALGESPIQHIRRFVVDRAKMLMTSGRTVTETAYDLGFDYPQHFTRVFKGVTGIQPSKYIDSLKSS